MVEQFRQGVKRKEREEKEKRGGKARCGEEETIIDEERYSKECIYRRAKGTNEDVRRKRMLREKMEEEEEMEEE